MVHISHIFYSIYILFLLDRGDLYFPEGRKIELRCKNITTEGHFVSVYWYSTAYATNGTEITDVYRYDITEKTHINHYFKKRIERINETSIRIKDARLSDSGRWKCDILYNNNGLKYIPQASYTVHIVSKYANSIYMFIITWWKSHYLLLIVVLVSGVESS